MVTEDMKNNNCKQRDNKYSKCINKRISIVSNSKLDENEKERIIYNLEVLQSQSFSNQCNNNYSAFRKKANKIMGNLYTSRDKTVFGIVASFVSCLLCISIILPISTKLKKEKNYKVLLERLSNYDGSNYDNDRIESLLIDIGDYKKTNEIKKDLKLAKLYISTIPSEWEKNPILSKCIDTRQYVKYLYTKANTSGLFDYDEYISTIGITYLVCGAEFSNDEHSFMWYKDNIGNHFDFELVLPMSYDNNKSYIFEPNYTFDKKTSWDGYTTYSNQNLKIDLKLESNTETVIDVLKINYMYYDEVKSALAANVYLYGTGDIETFYLVDN